MMLQIDTKDLTQDELDLLQSLIGSSTEKKMKTILKSKPCKQELKPYNLKVDTYCSTCETKHTQYFEMRLAEDCTHLYGVPVEPNTSYTKHERRTVRYCSCCRNNLRRFSQDELICKIMHEVTTHYE